MSTRTAELPPSRPDSGAVSECASCTASAARGYRRRCGHSFAHPDPGFTYDFSAIATSHDHDCSDGALARNPPLATSMWLRNLVADLQRSSIAAEFPDLSDAPITASDDIAAPQVISTASVWQVANPCTRTQWTPAPLCRVCESRSRRRCRGRGLRDQAKGDAGEGRGARRAPISSNLLALAALLLPKYPHCR